MYKFRDDYQLRTKERIIIFGKEAERSGKVVKGAKGRTVLSLLPGVDESTIVSAEFMQICLGVIRQVLEIWTTKSGLWNLKYLVPDLDKFLQHLKPPSLFPRSARTISDSPYWEAYDCLYWGMFYSILAFHSLLINAQWFDLYLQHWIQFVVALNILMQEQVTIYELEKCDSLLKAFVQELGTLYGEKELSHNLQQLLHACLNVRRWGQNFHCCSFPFENNIGAMGSTVHGNNNIGKEITDKKRLSQGVEVLRSTVEICHMSRLNENQSLGAPLKNPAFSSDECDLLVSVGLTTNAVQVFKEH